MLSRISSTGQSLLEVLIVLAVAIVVMTALVGVILNGLKNAKFAQNQAKSTKYAQEAVEQITAMRDRNSLINFNGTSQPFSNLFVVFSSASTPSCILPDTSAQCYFKLSSSISPPLQQVSYPLGIKQSLGNGLSREIYFENGSSKDEKKLTVKVIWTDASGDHESNLQTVLTSYIFPTPPPT